MPIILNGRYGIPPITQRDIRIKVGITVRASNVIIRPLLLQLLLRFCCPFRCNDDTTTNDTPIILIGLVFGDVEVLEVGV